MIHNHNPLSLKRFRYFDIVIIKATLAPPVGGNFVHTKFKKKRLKIQSLKAALVKKRSGQKWHLLGRLVRIENSDLRKFMVEKLKI